METVRIKNLIEIELIKLAKKIIEIKILLVY